ncbi:MAG: hypothetical protein Ct9H300mP27_11650 [Chloroflexota bacterium]|nr:MAG: hypothetical protein Ct9H300mP27_11650 [Chloroflexota bacterium]
MRPGGTQRECFQEYLGLADLGEKTGLDTVWLGESHFNQNRVVSAPIVIAGSIASRTKKLGLVWQSKFCHKFKNPLRIAEEAATVDKI